MGLESFLPRNALGGYLAMDQLEQRKAQAQVQQAMGIASILQRQREAAMEQQAFQAKMQGAQARAAQEQGTQDLLGRLYGEYQQSQADGMSPFDAQKRMYTGMLQNPATAQLGLQGLTKLEAEMGRREAAQATLQERVAAREQRMEELKLRMADARASAQDRIEAKRELMHLGAALRPPRQEPAPTTVQTEDGPMLVDRAGNARPIVGPTGQPVKAKTSDKPLTEGQGRAVMFGTRSAQADKVLRELEEKISTTGLALKQAAANVPLIGGVAGAAGNLLLSSEQQRVEQAQRDFVNAILRQESGAVISDAEFENAKKQYFPAPGDSKAVKDQKRKNRETAIAGFRRMAGPGGADIDAVKNEPLLPKEDKPSPDINELLKKYSG